MNAFIDTYKALIITILISSIIVLLAFSIHIKKRSTLVAETYFDMDSELIEEELEELEKLEDLLKSFDNISTNEAFNETKKYESQEDAEFEKKLDEIRNRNEGEEAKETKQSSEKEQIPEENPAFDEINKIINKRSQKNIEGANKNSSMSYSLVNRTHDFLPTPIYLCENGGKIVINITVNSDGDVTDANVNGSSSTTNGCLIDHALEYAKASRFSSDASKASQLGTITFLFRGKS